MRATIHKNAVKSIPGKLPVKSAAQPARTNSARMSAWEKTVPIQASLKINTPGDRYEQEADRVAGQVMRMSEPQVQRKSCACGKPAGPDGLCEDCKRKRLNIQRKANGEGTQTAAPPIVHQALQQPGRPLDGPTRNFMEARFGQDFGRVRVHTDAKAAESTREVNALAYTVGSNIVFDTGNYSPSTRDGKNLLAHELTHVIQQQFSHRLQRACPPTPTGIGHSPGRLECKKGGSEFVHGKRLKFCQDSKELMAGQEKLLDNIVQEARGASSVEVHGNASTEGPSAEYNFNLACNRAIEASDLLFLQNVTAPVTLVSHGPTSMYGSNLENRNVVFVFSHDKPEKKEEKKEEKKADPEKATVDPAKPICGPNVTKPVANVVATIKSDFKGLSKDQKTESCDHLDDPVYGLVAWDVRPLHQHKWIKNDYGPDCATDREDSVCCSRSVQIDNDCHYAGSVNYVAFGAMFKSCFDHFASIPDISGTYRFTDKAMMNIISLYKGGGVSGYSKPSGNFLNSQLWAKAGYQGWPAGGSPPAGDCTKECAPSCATVYWGRDFDGRWCPHIDPKKACAKSRTDVFMDTIIPEIKKKYF